MKKSLLRIATRKSPLALWQANYVKKNLEALYPTLTIELVEMTTEGDRQLATTLNKVGGKSLFVKELEQALLDDRADIAVHSMKDVPMEFPAGLGLAAICEREDPRDAFISNHYTHLNALPQGAVVGTSSLRRQCQVQALRPDIKIQPLRGNVNTRLQKLDDGEFDAIILAAAGLIRLGMAVRIKGYLTTTECLPAVGQGALGIEYRQADAEIYQMVMRLNHQTSYLCVTAERAMGKRLGSGCQVPVAGYATLENEELILQAMIGQPDGTVLLHASAKAAANSIAAEKLGNQVAEALLAQGAADILKTIHYP